MTAAAAVCDDWLLVGSGVAAVCDDWLLVASGVSVCVTLAWGLSVWLAVCLGNKWDCMHNKSVGLFSAFRMWALALYRYN